MPAAGAAAAGDLVSEVRLGVLAHDVGVFGGAKEGGADFSAEALFASPAILARFGAPRPHLGVSINGWGDTSQLYAGLTWSFDLPRAFFLDGSLGAAIHDGETGEGAGRRKGLGCRVLFRESLSLGYRFSERFNVSLMLDHISNGNTCLFNEGLDTFGLRFGIRY